MPGTILENLSGRKLSILVAILLVSQLVCFLVGVIAPSPARSQQIWAKVCLDTDPGNANDLNRWFTRENCHPLSLEDPKSTQGYRADQFVFVVQMPLHGVDFSRWQQNMVGILQFDIIHQHDHDILEPIIELTINSRLAYSNKLSNGAVGRTPWTYYTHAEEKRYMDCVVDDAHKTHLLDGYPYNCSMVPLFELGSIYHDYYLLNMRLPYDEKSRKNFDLPNLDAVYLHMIHMNGGFTRIWVGLKTFFFPCIVSILFWFWKRVHKLSSRKPVLLEYMLLALAATLAFLDCPLEYLTLWYDMPYMLLLSDIRQGIFYAALLSFWLVFAGEHMLIQDNNSNSGKKSTIKSYWKHLSTIVIGCLSLLIFDLCERGIQLVNPFYSIWVTPVGTNLALSFIILAGLSSGMYFVFLCFMIWRVFKNISIKRAVLPSMSQARRLHYEGIIYRFNFLMLATVVCAGVTVISFILSQVAEGQNKWDDTTGGNGGTVDFELSSVLHTGVYGMWNVYICAMLILYAPSHKQWPVADLSVCGGEGDGNGEEVEFSRLPMSDSNAANEISSLTSFATKASIE